MRQQALDSGAASQQFGTSLSQGASNRVIGPIPLRDVLKPCFGCYRLPVWSAVQVAPAQKVSHERGFTLERREFSGQPAMPSFMDSSGVMGNKIREPNLPNGCEPLCTVERVEPGSDQPGCIADVVQMCGRDEDLTVVWHQHATN